MRWKGENSVKINKDTLIIAMQHWLRYTLHHSLTSDLDEHPVVTDIKVISDRAHNFHGIEIVVMGEKG